MIKTTRWHAFSSMNTQPAPALEHAGNYGWGSLEPPTSWPLQPSHPRASSRPARSAATESNAFTHSSTSPASPSQLVIGLQVSAGGHDLLLLFVRLHRAGVGFLPRGAPFPALPDAEPACFLCARVAHDLPGGPAGYRHDVDAAGSEVDAAYWARRMLSSGSTVMMCSATWSRWLTGDYTAGRAPRRPRPRASPLRTAGTRHAGHMRQPAGTSTAVHSIV